MLCNKILQNFRRCSVKTIISYLLSDCRIRLDKFKQVHFSKTYIVLKLLLENKGGNLKINNGSDPSTIR